jgi:hypothetical protein
MLEEFEEQQEDEETIKELKDLKRERSFSSLINKRRLNRFELDEAMV